MRKCHWLYELLLLFVLTQVPGQAEPPEFTDVPEPVGSGWRLTWESTPDRFYRLERSTDLQGWNEVETVQADSTSTSVIDTEAAGAPILFWRVVVDDFTPGDPLVIGPITITGFDIEGASSTLDLEVQVGGTETVAEILFFDGSTELGPALNSFGEGWNISLIWDSDLPETRNFFAEVRTEEGSLERSEARALLLADPSKFVPISSDASPLYGEFVPVSETGELGGFLYYPESLANSDRATGVHFEFSPGAEIRPPSPPDGVRILFGDGKFFRGPAEITPPEAISGAIQSLDIDHLTPEEVAQAFGLGAGPIALDWGSGKVAWQSGALDSGGWSDLQIELPIGDFALPGGRFNATLGQDPETGTRFLIVSYYGTWVPLAGGPVFAIPQTAPLRIYLAENGEIAAHGTAEASFPNGAVVRGSISWRSPNFEFRFEGKGIVIPALDALRQLLPTDPLIATPSGTSPSDLDEFAGRLEGYRAAMRGIAVSGVGTADLASAETIAPLPKPTDVAGAAMEAWAGRIASWTGDRFGQTLTESETKELTKVIQQASKTAEAAHDLPTVLKLLKHALLTAQNIAPALAAGPTADALQSALAEADQRIFAAAERIITARPEYLETGEFFEIVNLLEDLKPLAIPPAPAPARKGSGPEAPRKDSLSVENRFRRIVAAVRAKMNLKRTFQAEFNNLSADELLNSLQTLVVILRQLRTDDTAGTPANAPPDIPIPDTNILINNAFIPRHNLDTNRALLSNRIGLLRDVLSDRAAFFAFNAELGNAFNSNSQFAVSTQNLIARYLDAFRNLPFSQVPVSCRSDWSWVEVLKIGTLDGGVDSNVGSAQTPIHQCDSLVAAALAQANNANTCDELMQALLKQPGVFLEPFRSLRDCSGRGTNRVKEGDAFMDITGSYEAEALREGPESAPSTESFVTMQINQAGRYFEGNLQVVELRVDRNTNSYRRSSARFRIDGLFTRRSEFGPGTAFGEMAIRMQRKDDNGQSITRFASGNAVNTADGRTMFFLSPAPISGQAALVFDRISPTPTLSTSILAAFHSDNRSTVEASQSSPLHSVLKSRLDPDVLTLSRKIKEYYNDSVPILSEQEATIAATIARIIANIRVRLTVEQYPLAVAYMKLTLGMQAPLVVKAEKVTLDPRDLGTVTRTRWDLLLAIAHHRHMSELLDLLNLTTAQVQALTGKDNYQYNIKMNTHQVTAGESLISFGAYEFEMLVTRTRGNEVLSFPLMGWFGTWSPALSLPVSCAIGTIELDFSSPYPLVAADFEGWMELIQIGGALALPGDQPNAFQILLDLEVAGYNSLVPEEFKIPPGSNAVSLGLINVEGSSRFPGLIIPLSGFADNDCFQVGVGLDVGLGWLEAFDANAPARGEAMMFEPGELLQFDFKARPSLENGVFFETNEFAVSSCGVQFLREYLAENRALFIGEKSRIVVKGYTDTQGSAGSNQTLSQNRAEAVKCVLEDLLGSALKVPISAQGLGEGPAAVALGQVPDDPRAPPEGTDDPLFRRADIIVGGHIAASIQAR